MGLGEIAAECDQSGRGSASGYEYRYQGMGDRRAEHQPGDKSPTYTTSLAVESHRKTNPGSA